MTKVTRRDVLKHARQLITPKGSWIKGDLFGKQAPHTQNGYRATSALEADCFCSLGAIDRALLDLGVLNNLYSDGDDPFDAAQRYAHELQGCIYNNGVPVTNPSYSKVYAFNDYDKRTQQEVLEKFDCAIEMADDEKDIRK